MAKPALGRGLGALMGGSAAPPRPTQQLPSSAEDDGLEKVRIVAPDQIRRSPFQPRKDFPPDALQELADSIKAKGIIQPLIVRQAGQHYELIAGERRWRAAQLAGLEEIPIIVREVSDTHALELALIENLQRENLNPMEEALGYSRLLEEFNLRQEDVASRVGRSRAVVANALRLLRLPEEVQNYVRDGRLSSGHAKVILGLTTPELQVLATERVLQRGLNVRQTEELVAQLQPRPASPSRSNRPGPARPGPDGHIASLENQLRERFGTKVHLRYKNGKGALDIRFYSDEDLERILQLLQIRSD